MKVVRARFTIDKDGNPSIISQCNIGIDETNGKFQMGFGLARDRTTQELHLFAFRSHPSNPIAVLRHRKKAVEWVKKALEKNGYKWCHIYTSDVERVNGMYAFMVPFDAEGWNELPEDVRQTFNKMLEVLEKEAEQ